MGGSGREGRREERCGGEVWSCSNLFSSCSVVLFVDEADAFLRKRSKVAIVCMTDNLTKRGRRDVE